MTHTGHVGKKNIPLEVAIDIKPLLSPCLLPSNLFNVCLFNFCVNQFCYKTHFTL